MAIETSTEVKDSNQAYKKLKAYTKDTDPRYIIFQIDNGKGIEEVRLHVTMAELFVQDAAKIIEDEQVKNPPGKK